LSGAVGARCSECGADDAGSKHRWIGGRLADSWLIPLTLAPAVVTSFPWLLAPQPLPVRQFDRLIVGYGWILPVIPVIACLVVLRIMGMAGPRRILGQKAERVAWARFCCVGLVLIAWVGSLYPATWLWADW